MITNPWSHVRTTAEQSGGLRSDDDGAGSPPYRPDVHLRRRDLLVAAAVAAFQVGATAGAASEQPDARAPDLISLLLLLAGPLALVLVRVRPEVPLAVSLGALVAYLARDYPLGPIFVAYVISLVTCVLTRRRAAVALAVVIVEVGVLTALATGEVGLGEVAGATAWTLTVVAVSEVVRTRWELAAQERTALGRGQPLVPWTAVRSDSAGRH